MRNRPSRDRVPWLYVTGASREDVPDRVARAAGRERRIEQEPPLGLVGEDLLLLQALDRSAELQGVGAGETRQLVAELQRVVVGVQVHVRAPQLATLPPQFPITPGT